MIIQKQNSLFVDTSEYKEITSVFEKIKSELADLNDKLKKTENSILLIKTINKEIKTSFVDIETTKNKIEEIVKENSK